MNKTCFIKYCFLVTVIISTASYISTVNAQIFYAYHTLGSPFNFIIKIKKEDLVGQKRNFKTDQGYTVTTKKLYPKTKKNTPIIITTEAQLGDAVDQLAEKHELLANKSQQIATTARCCCPLHTYFGIVFSYLTSSQWKATIIVVDDILITNKQIIDHIIDRIKGLSETMDLKYALHTLDLTKKTATYKITLPTSDDSIARTILAGLGKHEDDLNISRWRKTNHISTSDTARLLDNTEENDQD